MAERVRKTTSKPEIKVKVDIRPGPASPAARCAWARFWRQLAAKARDEAQGAIK